MNYYVLYSFYTIMAVKRVRNSGGHCLLTQPLVNGCPIFSNSNGFMNSSLFFTEFHSLTGYLSCSFRDILLPYAYSTLGHDLYLSA